MDIHQSCEIIHTLCNSKNKPTLLGLDFLWSSTHSSVVFGHAFNTGWSKNPFKKIIRYARQRSGTSASWRGKKTKQNNKKKVVRGWVWGKITAAVSQKWREKKIYNYTKHVTDNTQHVSFKIVATWHCGHHRWHRVRAMCRFITRSNRVALNAKLRLLI